jgi:GNAT superfamily N-acetyltransferase
MAVQSTRTGVVRVTDEHASALADFYARVWDPHATSAGVAAARRAAAANNPHGPGTEIPTFAFVDGDRVTGHLTTIPIQLWNGATELSAHWLKGLMVLPEYRNGPVGYLLVREALQTLECALAAVVATDARRLFSALGMVELGALPNRVKILSPRAVLQWAGTTACGLALPSLTRGAVRLAAHRAASPLAAGVVAAVTSLYAGICGSTRKEGLILPALPDRNQLDRLWESARGSLQTAVARNSSYIADRYGRASGYRWIGVYDGPRLTGFGALRAPRMSADARLQGLRVATLSEFLVHPDDPQSALALVKAAEAVAGGLAADAVLCSASHPSVNRILNRRAFLPYPANVRIMVRPAAADALAGSLNQWWITRGDSHADEVF